MSVKFVCIWNIPLRADLVGCCLSPKKRHILAQLLQKDEPQLLTLEFCFVFCFFCLTVPDRTQQNSEIYTTPLLVCIDHPREVTLNPGNIGGHQERSQATWGQKWEGDVSQYTFWYL